MPAGESNPADRRYTTEHEWIKPEGEHYIVGITAFAQDQLGDIVYVELPKVGDQVEAGRAFGVIESVKTASDLYAPVTGEVVAVNSELIDQPQSVNDDPYDAGWMIKIRPAEALSPPSLTHPFGTDQYGRDILSRAMTGARLSLLTGLGAVAVALTAGVVVGLACGVIGG